MLKINFHFLFFTTSGRDVLHVNGYRLSVICHCQVTTNYQVMLTKSFKTWLRNVRQQAFPHVLRISHGYFMKRYFHQNSLEKLVELNLEEKDFKESKEVATNEFRVVVR